jgi:hypothetical protein
LDAGSVLFVPRSENIEVRLKLMHGNALSSESVLYFINPERRGAAPPAARLSASVAPAKVSPAIAPAAPVSAAPASPAPGTQTSRPVPELQPEQPVQRVVEKRPAPETKTPVKAFQLPAVQALNATAQIAPINLPDLPDIHASAPAMPLANGSPLAAVLAAPAHLAGPPQLRSGRLIWTGSLHKNAVLSITPAGVSSGVLSGSLPGVPVKVSLQPAELVDGGIAVYSKDPERSGASQPPGSWNGWKVVVYDWDPKRIAEVDVLEPPSPANNWKRLVLRSENRNVSVFVVNWQRE